MLYVKAERSRSSVNVFLPAEEQLLQLTPHTSGTVE